jgi:hypothetical protein
LQIGDDGVDVVAHEIEPLLTADFGRMNPSSAGGKAKISHPPPASTAGSSSTSRKNARSRSASAVKITA